MRRMPRGIGRSGFSVDRASPRDRHQHLKSMLDADECEKTASSECAAVAMGCSSFCHPAGKCDALREVARSVAGRIRDPYSAGEIAAIIGSGDYSAEMMMQHLLLLVTNETSPSVGATDKTMSEYTKRIAREYKPAKENAIAQTRA